MSETFATNELIEFAGIKMTKGALIVVIIAFALAVIATLVIPSYGWVAGLGILLAGFFAAYVQNCAVVGHCTVLAVFLLILYIFSAISTMASIMIVRTAMKSLKGKKLKKK